MEKVKSFKVGDVVTNGTGGVGILKDVRDGMALVNRNGGSDWWYVKNLSLFPYYDAVCQICGKSITDSNRENGGVVMFGHYLYHTNCLKYASAHKE